MIRDDGWKNHSVWEHSTALAELYARRAGGREREMTCAAQAAELLKPHVEPGDTVLDVGCGSGHFYHSLRRRRVPAEYHGIDAAASLIESGRRQLAAFGLPPRRLRVLRIEDLDGEVDHTVCLNVLSNLDNFHRPLERILQCTRKTAILRESCKRGAESRYVTDHYLDGGCELKVYVNIYDISEFKSHIESYGFEVRTVTDRRTGGKPEMVIGYPHHWTFFVARRTRGRAVQS